MSYLHGSRVIEKEGSPAVISTVATGVVGLIGLAPAGAVNEMKMVKSLTDAEQFGAEVSGYSIPQALAAIFGEGGAASVIVINIAADSKYQQRPATAVTGEAHVVASASIQTDYYPSDLGTVVVKQGATTLTLTTDYTVAATGVITIVNTGTYPDTTALTVDYSHYEAITVTSTMKFDLAAPPKGGALTSLKNADGTTTYVDGTDYTVTYHGQVKIIAGGAITSGTAVVADYQELDLSAFTSADFVGTVSGSTRTGHKLYANAKAEFSVTPKIFIAPEWSNVTGVWQDLIVQATTFKGLTLIDADTGWTKTEAVDARAAIATAQFSTVDARVVLCYPRGQVFNNIPQDYETRALSQFVAGVIVKSDQDGGFWQSPSNKVIKGITGMELTLSWDITQSTTDANQLNEVGILTLAKGAGTGIRTWGNRNASFPGVTGGKSFISVRRTIDIFTLSVQESMLEFIDRVIDQALIDSIRQAVNNFIQSLKAQGAIAGGECTYDANKNPQANLDNGILRLDVTLKYKTPLEELLFDLYPIPNTNFE